jgi:hypothetical protein
MSDLDRALDAAVAFARRMLEQHGAFMPFAAVVDGEGVAIASAPEAARGGDAEVAVATLVAQLRARRRELWAVAVTTNQTVAELGDVVHVALEQGAEVHAVVLVPYRARRRGRQVEFGEPHRLPGAPQIWPPTTK